MISFFPQYNTYTQHNHRKHLEEYRRTPTRHTTTRTKKRKEESTQSVGYPLFNLQLFKLLIV